MRFLIIFILSIVHAYAGLDEFKSLAQDHVEQELFVGVSGAYLENGRLDYFSYGSSKLNGEKIDQYTHFEIASITKTFTSLLLAEFMVRNLINPNLLVEKYIPELAGKDSGKITIIELATHTSGLPKLPNDMILGDILLPYQDYTWNRMLNYLSIYQQKKKRPNKFEYSNLGYALLGEILARVGGDDYKTLIKDYILDPLKLEHTHFKMDDFADFSTGHLENLEETPFWRNLFAFNPAGALKSNTVDVMKYLSAQINPENSPLEKAINISQSVFYQGVDFSLGLGWFIREENNSLSYSHDGKTYGFTSLAYFNRQKKKAIVILGNSFNDFKCVGETFRNSPCRPDFGQKLDLDIVNKLTGKYKYLKYDATVELSQTGSFLILILKGQLPYRMKYLGNNEFSAYHNRAKLKFFMGPKDLAVKFSLTQEGNKYSYLRQKAR